MVTVNYTVKIGDFGMARDTYMSDYYRIKNAGETESANACDKMYL